ncbi:hypothetical protein BJV78DRAFT_237468 [Lactifluus subvellereus]|nr:hypothetical protein BJV78DRAFT_237468 [Lactifluus subvellereus]
MTRYAWQGANGHVVRGSPYAMPLVLILALLGVPPPLPSPFPIPIFTHTQLHRCHPKWSATPQRRLRRSRMHTGHHCPSRPWPRRRPTMLLPLLLRLAAPNTASTLSMGSIARPVKPLFPDDKYAYPTLLRCEGEFLLSLIPAHSSSRGTRVDVIAVVVL